MKRITTQRATFTRRNGSRFELEVEVSFEELLATLARKASSAGAQRLTRCDGAIVARVTELDR